MKRVLVTGGTGLLGGYVLRELVAAGHAVSNLSRTPMDLEQCEFIQGDIGDLEGLRGAFHGMDCIVHMAAVPGPGRCEPVELLQCNVMGTVNVLEAAVQSGVPAVVFASSGAAAGFAFQTHDLRPDYLPLDEDHPDRPEDDYGLSKLMAETACRRYSDRYGLRTVSLRVHHNWNVDRMGAETACRANSSRYPSVEELWSRRYLKALNEPDGDWPTPGPPRPDKLLWSFTDARDAATAFRLAVEADALQHEVFIINGHDTCSLLPTKELLRRHLPDVQTRQPLEGFATLWSYDKATRLLGYRPKFTWRDSDFWQWALERDAKAATGAITQ